MKNIDAKKIGELIKVHRKQIGITQSKLAEIIDLNDKQLGKIERGIHYPSVPTFLKIIKTLDIDINEFYPENIVHNSPLQAQINLIIKNLPEEKLELVKRVIEVI